MKIAVLGSGSGTNFEAIAKYFSMPEKKGIVDIVCVISDVKDAYILERAKRRNIPSYYIGCDRYKTKLDSATEEKYISTMKKHGAEFVVLAGFMRIVKEGILKAFPKSVINIHPALLPSFKGLKAWVQAYEYGVKITGCTVHFVDEGIDTGPIIAQRHIYVENNDTADIIHKKIQEKEYEIYPKVIEALALKKVKLDGRRVIIDGGNL